MAFVKCPSIHTGVLDRLEQIGHCLSRLSLLRSVTAIKPKKGQNVSQIKLSVYANYSDLIPLELQTEVRKKKD